MPRSTHSFLRLFPTLPRSPSVQQAPIVRQFLKPVTPLFLTPFALQYIIYCYNYIDIDFLLLFIILLLY